MASRRWEVKLGVLLLMAFCAPHAWPQSAAESKFGFNLDLDEMSRGYFQGRYRVEADFFYREPQDYQLKTLTGDSDLSGPVTYEKFYFGGPLLYSYTISLRPLDAEGRPQAVIATGSGGADHFWTSTPVPAFAGGPLESRLGGGLLYLSQLEFDDAATGRRVRLTIEGAQGIRVQFVREGTNLRFLGYAKNEPNILKIDAAATDANRYDGSLYRTGTIVEEGIEEAPSRRCGRPGQIRVLRPLPGPIDRVEVCYPVDNASGYERMVIGIGNPEHGVDYSRNIWSLSERVRPGGHIAQTPLVALDPESMSNANCFGYALLATDPGLFQALPGGAYWITGKADLLSDGTTPFKTILRTRFEPILRVPDDEAASLSRDPRLSPGDLVALFNGLDYEHAGVLIAHGSELWLESKMGESSVYDTPLDNLKGYFDTTYIEVYRPKP